LASHFSASWILPPGPAAPFALLSYGPDNADSMLIILFIPANGVNVRLLCLLSVV